MMKKIVFTLIIACFGIVAYGQLFPDRITTNPRDGWKSCVESNNPNNIDGFSHWILFDFLVPKDLTTLKIWNHNDPANLDDGVNAIKVEYSLDNTTWTEFGTFSVTQAQGSSFYEGEDILNFNGISARYVIITAISNYGGTCYGFDEARFYLGVAVPIELASFTGTCKDGNKKLSWDFADISDFGSVDVEWSSDGLDWERIYTSSSVGEELSGNIHHSEFVDRRELKNDHQLYRLKLNDINGDFVYSNIIQISCELEENDISIFPNPIKKEMIVDMELIESSEITYTITDVLGKVVSDGIFHGNEGNNRFVVNVSDLLNGSYFVHFDLGSKIIKKKVLKME